MATQNKENEENVINIKPKLSLARLIIQTFLDRFALKILIFILFSGWNF